MTGNRSYLQQSYLFNTGVEQRGEKFVLMKEALLMKGILSGIITDVFMTTARWPMMLGGKQRTICVCCIGEHCPSTASML